MGKPDFGFPAKGRMPPDRKKGNQILSPEIWRLTWSILPDRKMKHIIILCGMCAFAIIINNKGGEGQATPAQSVSACLAAAAGGIMAWPCCGWTGFKQWQPCPRPAQAGTGILWHGGVLASVGG